MATTSYSNFADDSVYPCGRFSPLNGRQMLAALVRRLHINADTELLYLITWKFFSVQPGTKDMP